MRDSRAFRLLPLPVRAIRTTCCLPTVAFSVPTPASQTALAVLCDPPEGCGAAVGSGSGSGILFGGGSTSVAEFRPEEATVELLDQDSRSDCLQQLSWLLWELQSFGGLIRRQGCERGKGTVFSVCCAGHCSKSSVRFLKTGHNKGVSPVLRIRKSEHRFKMLEIFCPQITLRL